MTPRQIEAFREAVLHGSLTAAALTLNISQPAVSRMMKDLEQEVGFVLFERRQGRMQPTHEALMLYEEVERSFVGLEKIRKTAQQIQQMQSGRLRLAAMPALGASLLPLVMDEFLRAEPDVALALEVHSSKVVVDLVQEQQVEMGFVEAQTTPVYSSVQRAMRIHVPCVCAFHKDHKFADQPYVAASDMQGQSLIDVYRQSQITREMSRIFNVQNINVAHRVQTSWFHTACQFVAQGHGVAIVDLFTAQNFNHPDFRYCEFRPEISFILDLIYPPVQAPNELVDRFIKRFLAHLPGEVKVETVAD
ncbi:LysR substrate-binding domain-containing protein [Marinobacterium arenosum]|uniref:LysR substrate-binding domain-containing protein n=1 Tax=Marinobacterium arenosum TaxID=2862496 RepID=UPI001C96009D|nr:LysR substrate-binding domain-containing protein [Marinobacterium arenosum]MBY4676171.1 LysR family transcriptional regulator [Marinobacterium arenosum]